MNSITRQVMHGVTCHAEAAVSSAAVELSAVAIAERMLPLVGSRRVMQYITRQVMHGIMCHAAAASKGAAVEIT